MTWIQTHCGHAVDLGDPQPGQIHLWDIAWALGHLCRWTGHTDVFYSVAEHSVHVADLVRRVNPALEFPAVMHDAEEAYIGDISSPLKALMRECGFDPKYIAAPFKRVIGRKFGIVLDPEDPVVRQADLVALLTERRDLMMAPVREWGKWSRGIEPAEGKLVPLGNPVKAATLFYHRAVTLWRASQGVPAPRGASEL